MEIFHGENFSLHRNRAVLQLAHAQLSQQREAEHLLHGHDNWSARVGLGFGGHGSRCFPWFKSDKLPKKNWLVSE